MFEDEKEILFTCSGAIFRGFFIGFGKILGGLFFILVAGLVWVMEWIDLRVFRCCF